MGHFPHMHSATISDSAQALAVLLRHWSRQQIHQALQQFDDPELALRRGEVEDALATVRRRTGTWNMAPADGLVGLFDAQYPPLLAQIPDPPLLVAYRGALHTLSLPTVAIVGARRCTQQGRRWAEQAAAEIAAAGACVVSGLALGIDGAAHHGALDARGATAAVLGSGLDNVAPLRHVRLAERILAAGGVILSEYPAGRPPLPAQFPERNRLISGLSMAVVVVQAGQRSGSLITARLALEQGRDVMAVPGVVGSWTSQGCHRLIQQGAGLVESAQDVIATMGLESGAPASVDMAAQSPARQQLLGALREGAAGLDELCALTGRAPDGVMQDLVALELEGFVEQSPLGYIRTS